MIYQNNILAVEKGDFLWIKLQWFVVEHGSAHTVLKSVPWAIGGIIGRFQWLIWSTLSVAKTNRLLRCRFVRMPPCQNTFMNTIISPNVFFSPILSLNLRSAHATLYFQLQTQSFELLQKVLIKKTCEWNIKHASSDIISFSFFLFDVKKGRWPGSTL